MANPTLIFLDEPTTVRIPTSKIAWKLWNLISLYRVLMLLLNENYGMSFELLEMLVWQLLWLVTGRYQ
jgi:hypothetical protein